MSRAAAVLGALVLAPTMAFAQQPCTSDANQVVDAIYQQVLERPSAAAAADWAQRLQTGNKTVRDVVRDVAHSTEHMQRFLSTNGRDAQQQSATYLYRHVLGRQVDESGLRSTMDILASRGPGAAIDWLISSAEYQQNFGNDTVPGKNVRYCGPGSQAQTTTANPAAIDGRFRGMDANNDGSISRGEWRGSQQSFRVHDWNNDGTLSGDELRRDRLRARELYDEDFTADNSQFTNWTANGFANLDDNGDGVITRREWHYDLESFRRTDRNRDGILSRQEFLATDMDDDRDDRFENLDVNRNGRIEQNEWHGSTDAFTWLDRNRDGALNRTEVVGDQAQAVDRFNSLDVNGDSRISANEWHWSRRSFEQQDANGDGVLTRREFQTGGAVPTTGR